MRARVRGGREDRVIGKSGEREMSDREEEGGSRERREQRERMGERK